jgi:riboflavin synthase
MFTGIITGVGRIVAVHDLGSSLDHGKRLTVQTPAGYLSDTAIGDSIAINGACMTATAIDLPNSSFCIDVSAESLDKTAGMGQPGPVNLEKALRANDRLDGHLVTGHVDAVGTVTVFEAVGESLTLQVLTPPALARYLAVKGSIAINGVSLTVNTVHDLPQGCEFSVNLIPHTAANTSLGSLVPGARVNLEIDLIARYVERMLGARTGAGRDPLPKDPK